MRDPFIRNGHLRGPVTLTPVAEHLTVELSLPVIRLQSVAERDSNTKPSACKAKVLTDCGTPAVSYSLRSI